MMTLSIPQRGLVLVMLLGVSAAPAVEFDLGLRYDRSRSGHGLEIHRAGDAYPVFFYTYREDLSPDWFFCDAREINGVLQGECTRFTSDLETAQADDSDRAFMTLDTVEASRASSCSTERPGALQLAEFSFSTVNEHQDWCTEFLAVGSQFPDPYLGGIWFGGDAGGYGCSLSHMDDVLSAICYFYDGQGEPRWAIGLQNGLDLTRVSEVSIDMVHYNGFCRGCETTELQPLPAGTLNLQLDPESELGAGGNSASLVLDYPQDPGGAFHRDFPLFRLTDGQAQGEHQVPMDPVQSDAQVQAWEADLQYFGDQLRAVHPDPFHDTSEATFESAVSSLRRRMPYLSDAQISYEFAKLAALISRNGRHGHTSAVPITSPLLPLQFYLFSDGTYIVDALPPYEGLIGSKVLGVGDKSMDEVIRRVDLGIPRDNENSARWIIPTGLLFVELYEGAGIIEAGPALEMDLETAGQVTREQINPITIEEYAAWKQLGKNTLPARDVLYLSDLEREFWFTSLEDGEVLYVQYNQVVPVDSMGQTLQVFVNQLETTIERDQPSRIIVDVRHNNGGDNTTYGPLLDLLTRPEISQDGRLLTIIGRQTFSATTNFIADLEAQSETIFVGEGIGGSPFHFGDGLNFLVPSSRLSLEISSRVHQSSIPGDLRLEIPPDVPVQLSSQDYFSDHDPVLAAAVDYVHDQ